eukprot:gene16851-22336_t
MAGRAARQSGGTGYSLLIALLRMLGVITNGCERVARQILEDPSNLFVVDLASTSSENTGIPKDVQLSACYFIGSNYNGIRLELVALETWLQERYDINVPITTRLDNPKDLATVIEEGILTVTEELEERLQQYNNESVEQENYINELMNKISDLETKKTYYSVTATVTTVTSTTTSANTTTNAFVTTPSKSLNIPQYVTTPDPIDLNANNQKFNNTSSSHKTTSSRWSETTKSLGNLSPRTKEMAKIQSEIVRERRKLNALQEEHTDLLGLLAQQELELTIFKETLEKSSGLSYVIQAEEEAQLGAIERYGSYVNFRRSAAVTIAQRVSKERKSNIGHEVGYNIRFDDRSSNNTKIKYVTDGVLLREFINNPTLSNYSIVILDEAHERSLQTDILMGLLKQLQETRNDLRIVVMSATLQVDLFMNYFKDTNLVKVPGRQYPVSIYYVKEPESDFIEAAMLTCLQIHEDEDPGGVLVFLPGQEDIENLRQMLLDNLPDIRQKKKQNLNNNNDLNKNDFIVRPLYASMSSDEQLKAFSKSEPGIRKFILATNIAETSVTISGIKYVVDTGYYKSRLIQLNTGMEMLKVLPISQSQANQRAGRAGRESPGKCFRLYTENSYDSLELTNTPEIQRVNLSQVILQLKLYGLKSIQDFPFISRPEIICIKKALEELLLLDAIDQNQELTNHGRRMACLPLTPIFANLLLKSEKYNCTYEIIIAVSMLSSDNIFSVPLENELKKKASLKHNLLKVNDGDLLTLNMREISMIN